jgi:hypothetical protein
MSKYAWMTDLISRTSGISVAVAVGGTGVLVLLGIGDGVMGVNEA